MTNAAPGGLFTVDLASTVGWAYGSPGANQPRFGVWNLPKIGGLGAKLVTLSNYLEDYFEQFQPRHVAMESPLPVQAMNNAAAAAQQMGMAAYVVGEAYRASVAVHQMDAYSIRLEVLGTGRFPKGEVKSHVVAWCQRHGMMVPDHNAGDAVLVYEYFRRTLNRAETS